MGRRLGVTEDYLATGLEREAGGEDRKLLDAEVALRLGDVEDASRLYAEVLDGAATLSIRARALAGQGQIAFELGEPRRAIDLLEQAVSVSHTQISDQPALADTLGRAYATVDDFEPAIRIFRQALAAAEQRKDTVEAVRFGVLLANAYIDTNEFRAAEELLEKTIGHAPDSSDPIFRARIYWSQSRLYTMREDPTTAARYARKALELLELTEHTHYAARAHHLLAHVELDRGNAAEALDLIDRGLPLVEASGNRAELALFRLERSRALVALGRNEEATASALESAERLAEVSPNDAGRGYGLLGEILESVGDMSGARARYEQAIPLLEGGPNRYLVEVYGRLAALHEAEGRPEEALALLKKAMNVQSPASTATVSA
jgi:tetratricopeptide (TPR) repeat protein